jgi:hypothetical protein
MVTSTMIPKHAGKYYLQNKSRSINESINQMVKPIKQKKIIELALTKMPLDKFDYYSLVDPFADGYYKIERKNAQDSSQVNV